LNDGWLRTRAEAAKQIRSWRRVGEIPEEFTFLPIDFGFIHMTTELCRAEKWSY